MYFSFLCFKTSPPVEPLDHLYHLCMGEKCIIIQADAKGILSRKEPTHQGKVMQKSSCQKSHCFLLFLSFSFEIHEDEVQLLFPIHEMRLNTLLPKAS